MEWMDASRPLSSSVSGELGLRDFLEAGGHELVVTADRDGPDSDFERTSADAEVHNSLLLAAWASSEIWVQANSISALFSLLRTG